VFLGDAQGLQVGHQGWRAIADTIDWVCEHWDQPDEGIWETRGGRKDFTTGGSRAGWHWTGRSGWPSGTAGRRTWPGG
jgi:hypothetical protein